MGRSGMDYYFASETVVRPSLQRQDLENYRADHVRWDTVATTHPETFGPSKGRFRCREDYSGETNGPSGIRRGAHPSPEQNASQRRYRIATGSNRTDEEPVVSSCHPTGSIETSHRKLTSN